MQHIYVNFKRFDVPASMGGVNRLSDAKDYGSTIVKAVCPDLKAYAGEAEFVHFYPESLLPSAIEGADPSRPIVLPLRWQLSDAPIRS